MFSLSDTWSMLSKCCLDEIIISTDLLFHESQKQRTTKVGFNKTSQVHGHIRTTEVL